MKTDEHVCVKFLKLKLVSNILRHFGIQKKKQIESAEERKETLANIDAILKAVL